MATEVILGLDCGTSYIKLSIFHRDGIELYRRRVPSPAFNPAQAYDAGYAATLWRIVERLLGDAMTHAAANALTPLAVAVVGISPVLTLFDPAHPDRALMMPYWHIPSVDGSAKGLERTVRRIKALRVAGGKSGLSNALVSDLIGYINYRLTGNLTINSMTAAELGFLGSSQLLEQLAHSSLGLAQFLMLPPSGACGVSHVASVGPARTTVICAGAPDSFGTALGAGATRAGAGMVYLGTFGSFLEVLDDLHPLITGGHFPRLPYRWRLSVPHFGATVEAYARTNFPTDSLTVSLRQLDQAAASAPPGAHGVFFHLPWWNDIGAEEGRFGFDGWREQGPPPQPLGARAVLESIAYALRSRTAHVTDATKQLGLAGGGAGSPIWRQLLADALGIALTFPHYPAGALGAATIALSAVGSDLSKTSAVANAGVTIPDPLAHSDTNQTALAANKWYASH